MSPIEAVITGLALLATAIAIFASMRPNPLGIEPADFESGDRINQHDASL